MTTVATQEPGRSLGAARIRHAAILGVRVHLVTREETGAILAGMASPGMRHVVVPVNPEMIIAARTDAAFRAVLNAAALALPDGTGVKLAARLLGHGPAERVTGIDTVGQIAGIARAKGLRLFLLGAAPGIAERAGTRLQADHPGLVIAGTHACSPRPEEEEDICNRINASGAEILLVAYGAPKQELWLSRNLPRLSVGIAFCVGGSFDFLAGAVTRAPGWMQSAGLEWLYRLLQEPRRWRRMLALPKFALLVIAERMASTSRRGSA